MTTSGVAPRLSVVIPHFGDPNPTRALVTALSAQLLATTKAGGVAAPAVSVEVIIVDDASPEPLVDLPAPAVLIRRDTNGGFGSAINTGAKHAQGDHLVLLNSDLIVPPNFLSQLQKAIRLRPDAVLSPRVLDSDGNPAWIGRAWPTTSHQVVEWLTPLARFRDTRCWHRAVGHRYAKPIHPIPVPWLVGAALVVPRAAFEQVGGFDERFFMNCEEIDLQKRLSRAGHPSILLPEPQVTHLSGGSTDPERHREWLVKARLTYAAKYGSVESLRSALRLASLANFLVNCLRRTADPRVRPLRTAREELRLINQPVGLQPTPSKERTWVSPES